MLKKIHTIKAKNQARIRTHLEEFKPLLKNDVSRYANGRQRFWIRAEWDLQKKCFHPAIDIPRLDRYLKAIGIEYDLGLIAYGSVGIDWHRDDSYAEYPAISINLSSQPYAWGYQACYPGYFWSRQVVAERKIYQLQPGDIIKFNCKNPHAAIGRDSDRWSINLWKVKNKYQHDYKSVIE